MAIINHHRLVSVSSRLNRHISKQWGDHLNFWHVIEYPKAGGTWLSRMLANYLDIPFPQHSVFPSGCASVLHAHWGYTPKLKRVFYLTRDGRDTMVSLYFMRMKAVKRSQSQSDISFKNTYTKIFGPGFDPDDAKRNLPKFIEHEMLHPRSCRINWPDHVEQWLSKSHPQIAFLSYEELRTNPVATLDRCLEQITGSKTNLHQLQASVDRFSFTNMTGRQPGNEDKSSFLRKGVVGDWKNHFSEEASRVFDSFAKQQMINLGYYT